MDSTPVCPYCDTELEYDDLVDNNYDGSRHESIWEGHCPVCGKIFTWVEIYLFDRIANFEEEEMEEE